MRSLALLCAAVTSPLAAQAFPLPATTTDRTAVANTAPFLVPTRMTQALVTNRNTLVPLGLPSTFVNWDMIAIGPQSRYVFVPSEAGSGAGVFRYDTQTGTVVVLMQGRGGLRTSNPAIWNPLNDEFARLDPATLTPWNTIVTGEETTGGRLFEITNPFSNGPYQVEWRSSVPAMAHEGTRFDSAGNLYTIDESASGSIYKFVPQTPGDLSTGQTFVLSADAYQSDPTVNAAQSWDATVNRPSNRFGPATWIPLTSPTGGQITIANPFAYVTTTGGRTAADELKGTPYGRPEDLEINTLASGNECLYVALTSETRVLSIELLSGTTAMIREFVNYDTINLATGSDVNPQQSSPFQSTGSGTRFNSPDNLAVDAFGSIYVVEDSSPGDIWKTVDADKDGVAEAIGIFVSLGVAGSEPSGFIADPNDPYRFWCCVQHPSSGNEALWTFHTRPYPGSDVDLVLQTGVNAAPTDGPGETVKDIFGFDTATFAIDSPNGTLHGAPIAILLQGFPTAAGQLRFLPPLWLNPLQLILPLGPAVLTVGGLGIAFPAPPGLVGTSVMAQGIAVTPVGALVVTDGHEYVLH